jgi:hypothetical protein
MNNSDATQIFVSYPRSDGELFATELHDRLVELGFQVWRDRTSIEPGKDWWQQIVTAIRQVKFMLLVMTPAALESKWMREEWRLSICKHRQPGGMGTAHPRAVLPVPRGACAVHGGRSPGGLRAASARI